METYELCRDLQKNLKGVSQRTVADQVGVSQATVNTIFAGSGKDDEKVILIAVYLVQEYHRQLREAELPDLKKDQLSELVEQLSGKPELQGRLKPADSFAQPDGPIPFSAKNFIRRPELDEIDHIIRNPPFSIMLNGENRSGLSTVMAYVTTKLEGTLSIIMDFKELGDMSLWDFLKTSLYYGLTMQGHKLDHDLLSRELNKNVDFLFWLQSLSAPIEQNTLWQMEHLHLLSSVQLDDLSGILLSLASRRHRVPGFNRISFLVSANSIAPHFYSHTAHSSDFFRQKTLKYDIYPFDQGQVKELASAYGLDMAKRPFEIFHDLGQPLCGGQPAILNKLFFQLYQEKTKTNDSRQDSIPSQFLNQLKQEVLRELEFHAQSLFGILRVVGQLDLKQEEEVSDYLNNLRDKGSDRALVPHILQKSLYLSSFFLGGSHGDEVGNAEVKPNKQLFKILQAQIKLCM